MTRKEGNSKMSAEMRGGRRSGQKFVSGVVLGRVVWTERLRVEEQFIRNC